MTKKQILLRRIFAGFICFLLFILNLPVYSLADTPVVLVSLGDSIPNGYGLTDKNAAYPVLISKRLDAIGIYLSQDGVTSEGILSRLESGAYDNALSQADIITLSIGGNDFLSKLNFEAFFLFVQGDPSKLQAIADDGVVTLSSNLPKIVSNIVKKAPRAKLILQTIYNPYAAFTNVVAGGVVFSDFVDSQIERLNQTIRLIASENAFIELCDVYASFSQSADHSFVNAIPDPLIIDPHPTPLGHLAISDVMWQVLMNMGVAEEDGLGPFLKIPQDETQEDMDETDEMPPPSESAPTKQPDEQNPKDENSDTLDSQNIAIYLLCTVSIAAVLILAVFSSKGKCK